MSHQPQQQSFLNEYIRSLQSQNQAILTQQQTLYREIQSLKIHNEKMQEYYVRYKDGMQECRNLVQMNRRKDLEIEGFVSRIQYLQRLCEELQRESFNNKNDTNREQRDQSKIIIQNLQKDLMQIQFKLQESDKSIEEYLQKMIDLKNSQNKMKQDLQQYKRRYFQQKNKNIEVTARLKEVQNQAQGLKDRLKTSQIQRLQSSLHELAQNYEKVQCLYLEKEQTTREMEEYIQQLQYHCQVFNQKLMTKHEYINNLEEELQYMQASLKKKNILRGQTRQEESDTISMLTQSISKMDLIRMNNKMVEKLAGMENSDKENMRLANFMHNNNVMNFKNNFVVNNRERQSYSECGKYQMNSSPSKLQMRINTLKMENQNLMRNLAI